MDDDSLPSTKKRRHRWWRLAALLAGGVALTSITYVSWTDVRDDMRAVEGDLAATAADLDGTSVKIVHRYTTLAEVRADLAASEDALRRRTEERDALEDRVIAGQASLDKTNGLIGDRSSELGQREANLALLSRCFVGASEALNQIAVADLSGFVATLQEVESACSSARAVL